MRQHNNVGGVHSHPDNVTTFKGESAQIYPAKIEGEMQQVNVCRCEDVQWKEKVCRKYNN